MHESDDCGLQRVVWRRLFGSWLTQNAGSARTGLAARSSPVLTTTPLIFRTYSPQTVPLPDGRSELGDHLRSEALRDSRVGVSDFGVRLRNLRVKVRPRF